jgi:hypothetical protein
VKHYQAVYECNIWADNLRDAKRQLREVFEFGVTPREACDEMIDGLKEVKPPRTKPVTP